MTIGIGVIGTGFMGRTWTEVASNHVAETQVLAVAGGSRAARLASDYRVILATWSRQLRGTPRRRSMPMKITSVETIELSHRLNRPTGPASVLNETRSTLIVRIATDEGLIGWGETSPLDGVRETIMGTYANALRGRDPLDAGRVWRAPWLAPFESGLAAGAVDIALHDLRGKALGVPINRLYGGGLRTSVEAYASGLCYFKDVDPADQWMDEALGLVARGFRAIKMRIGRFPPAHEVPLVARVREALPPDVRLMVDAWGSYTLPTALRVGRELQELGVYWYEE